MACLLLFLPAHLQAVDKWVSPNGSGTSGSSSNSPALFSVALVNDWLDDATDLTVHFLHGTSGVYDIYQSSWPPFLHIAGDTNRTVALIGYPDANGNRPTLKLGSIQDHANFYPDNWTTTVTHQWLMKNATSSGKVHYLKRIVVENLILDGNFAGQGAWTSEANATGYKSFALELAAATGRIRNVLVKNFGSVGPVPWSFIHQLGGVEAFPINVVTFDQSQTALDGDSHPWVIEDTEVADFHTLHGGYGTLIMPHVLQGTSWAAIDASPVVVVRRCQVRGNDSAIALGTAWRQSYLVHDPPGGLTGGYSGRIRFEDNVVVNGSTGFNTDTGPIGPLNFTNNAFLDVQALGNLGVADSSYGSSAHRNYALSDNLVRLRGRVPGKLYSNLCTDDPDTAASDPNLALGRPITMWPSGNPASPSEGWHSAGLILSGTAGNVRLERTDFTAWPVDNFYLPNPANTTLAKFRLIWKLADDTSYACWIYKRFRADAQDVTLTDNRLSQTAYDFANWTTLANATNSAFGPASAAKHTDERTPSSTNPTGFQPKGRLQRALMVTNGSARLTAVREVQLGQATYTTNNNGTLTIVARLAEHRLRAGGSTGTVPLSGYTLYLNGSIVLSDWEEYSGTNSATTDANGVATFTVATDLNGNHGVFRFSAWLDGGTGNGVLDPHRDAWASHSYPIGATVELTASPDVGDDKNTATGKRAKIRATRTGATNASLVVNLTLHSGVYFKPNTSSDLAGTYGTTGTADYYVTSGTGTWSTSSPYTSATLTIPAGAYVGEVSVVTRTDELTEQNLIIARLAESANYAPGVSTNVHVLIFDGPEWTLLPLTMDYGGHPYYTQTSAAYAVNDVNGATLPRITGYGTWHYYYSGGPPSGSYYSYTYGGYWSQSSPNNFNYFENMIYRGISTDPVVLVGTLNSGGDKARVKPLSGAAFNLPHHFSNGYSQAWGVRADAGVIVGSSQMNGSPGTTRPVSWSGSGSTYTSFDVGGALDADWSGRAYGVNIANQVVGEMYVEYTGTGATSGTYAFRTSADEDEVQEIDLVPSTGAGAMLHAPGTSANKNGIALAVSANLSGATVGVYFDPATSKTKGVYWPATSTASSATAIDLKAWKAKQGSAVDSFSQANSINNSGWIVGWSGSSGSTPVRAVLKKWASSSETDWQDLNDKHFVHGTTGRVLKEASAINTSGHIVGSGTLNGSNRGFVLIPRTPGN